MATMDLGASYSPNAQKKTAQQPGTPIQQALQILSLHLPRVLGASAPGPRELLAAGGQFRPAPNVTGLVQTPPPAPTPGAAPGGPSFGGVGGGAGMAGRATTPGFEFGVGGNHGPIQITPRPGYPNTGVVPPPMPAPAPGPTGPSPQDIAEFQRRMQQQAGSQGYRGGPMGGPPMRPF